MPDTNNILSDERIEQLFYPMGTATGEQLSIARAIGRAIEREVIATLPASSNPAPAGAVARRKWESYLTRLARTAGK